MNVMHNSDTYAAYLAPRRAFLLPLALPHSARTTRVAREARSAAAAVAANLG